MVVAESSLEPIRAMSLGISVVGLKEVSSGSASVWISVAMLIAYIVRQEAITQLVSILPYGIVVVGVLWAARTQISPPLLQVVGQRDPRRGLRVGVDAPCRGLTNLA